MKQLAKKKGEEWKKNMNVKRKKRRKDRGKTFQKGEKCVPLKGELKGQCRYFDQGV